MKLTFASHLVNEFGLPEEHWVSLVLRCFFLNAAKNPIVNLILHVSVRNWLAERVRKQDLANVSDPISTN